MHMDYDCSMKIVKPLLTSLLFLFSLSLFAEEETSSLDLGYISDDLFIYMHSGPGNHFRILGSINSGTEIKLTGEQKNEYTQIIDTKERKTWVESKYVSVNPGLRNIIAELNGKLANNSEETEIVASKFNEAQNTINALESERLQLEDSITKLNKELIHTKSQLKDQDMNMKKEWFYNGALVLLFGLILGVVLPKLGSRKKANMESWK